MVKKILLLLTLTALLAVAHGLSEGMNNKLFPSMFKNIPTSEPKASAMITAHVVAHTHDDVGWLKTVDQYYYGANMSIQDDAGVQYTIDTVIYELAMNPARKFIYVEMAYFYRWWREQTDDIKTLVKNLVKNKQLEFINGGWCMHDEASTFYEDMIDQMTLGHRFLATEFDGAVPKIGWQIDPFGHSSTNALIDYDSGFEALFFARMDYQDLNIRIPQKGLEMNWQMSQSSPDKQLFTGMMFNGYCNPGEFMFEWSGNDPIMDDPLLEGYNVEQKATDLVNSIKGQSAVLRHNEVMLSWGCDFAYINAHRMFKNIDKLMDYVNKNSERFNVTMIYSTPSIYAEAVTSQGISYPSKSDDFFPYADGPHAYWTGYFTSRPALKGYVRSSNNLLQATTQLYSLSGSNDETMLDSIFQMQEPMGVAQHHDGVSGTEKQHVADDYAKRLYIGSTYANGVISEVVNKYIGGSVSWGFCPSLNESICPSMSYLSNGTVAVVAYNPLAWTRTEYITLPIATGGVSVVDSTGNTIPSQISKVGNANTPYSLTFAALIGPMSFTTYFVQPGSSDETETSTVRSVDAGITLDNNFITVNLDSLGNFVSITNKASGKTVNLSQNHLYYISSTGTPDDGQCSGAYIFRPANNTPVAYSPTSSPVVTVSNGSVFTEVQRVFSPYLSQFIRLYADQTHIEVVDIVGPIDVSDGVGKEVISRFTTDLATAENFWTDSNGIEMQARRINYRPSWPYQVVEAIAGNYYPINSLAYIKDTTTDTQFTMVTDRSRGGGSMADGQLEGMIHRATTKDDGRGVGEPIDEHNVVSTTSWLVVDSAEASAGTYRQAAARLNHPFVLAFASTPTAGQWIKQYKTNFNPLTGDLPPNVQLQTFAPTENSGEFIMRFHHIFQVGEDANLSQPVTFDMNAILSGYEVASAQETTLTTVKEASRPDAIRFNKKKEEGSSSSSAVKEKEKEREKEGRQSIKVTLTAAEIRTFLVTFSPVKREGGGARPHSSMNIIQQ